MEVKSNSNTGTTSASSSTHGTDWVRTLNSDKTLSDQVGSILGTFELRAIQAAAAGVTSHEALLGMAKPVCVRLLTVLTKADTREVKGVIEKVRNMFESYEFKEGKKFCDDYDANAK